MHEHRRLGAEVDEGGDLPEPAGHVEAELALLAVLENDQDVSRSGTAEALRASRHDLKNFRLCRIKFSRVDATAVGSREADFIFLPPEE